MIARFALPFVVLLGACGCTTYEYEEEAFLDVDGSGTIRVSGSREILEAVSGRELRSVEDLAPLVTGEAVELLSERETLRGGRSFFHVEGRFGDWNDLCRRPWFRDRRCRLVIEAEEIELLSSFPAPSAREPGGIDPDAEIAVRFHFPGTVRYHNARGEVERGNIVSWIRPVRGYFGEDPPEIEARFERESILAATVRIVLIAVALVVVAGSTAIALLVRKGRRQLQTDQLQL